jgi:processive 1,2-diacylglycerol beta-glucosyltransferase
MKKVLILTASFGEGHNSAARNIREALELESQDTAVELLDLFASTYGVLNTIIKKTYLQIVEHTPKLWNGIYNWLDTSSSAEGRMAGMVRLRQALSKVLAEFQPDCVVSTYPAYAHVIKEIYRDYAERPFRIVTVITDSISLNSIWFKADSDVFCVPNEFTAAVLKKAHIASSKIKTLGFPVHPAFAEEPAPEVIVPSEKTRPKVLYVANSGKKRVRKTLEGLLEIPELEITVTVGRDSELKAKLLKMTRDNADRVKVFGWTNQMPHLMRTNHFLVSKAGGATVVNIRQPQRDQAQADAPLPSSVKHCVQPTIYVGLQVSRFDQAFAGLIFGHVVVPNFHAERTNAPALLPHLGKKVIGHAAQGGFDVILIGEVAPECLLMTECFLRLPRRD